MMWIALTQPWIPHAMKHETWSNTTTKNVYYNKKIVVITSKSLQ